MHTDKNFDPYQVRFAWFWFRSREIFEFTEEDMERKVKLYADQGITHLITFSCTHFRWSFKPWWDKIDECLAMIVRCAHKYDLKVVEHHSSCLTFYPINHDYGKNLDALNRYFETHGSALADWPGFLEYNLDLAKRESQWDQIDAVTGEKINTWYHGYIKCPNNKEYVDEYLKYLERVYALGVDGIMTDDMQFANQNVYAPDGSRTNLLRSCGCVHCRKAFKEQYGYELPAPEKWDEWFGSMSDHTFLDFLDFRRRSCLNFHHRVKAHYESLGLQMLRPNYNSTPIQTNPRGTLPGNFPELDWFMQECNCSSIIDHSWLYFLMQQNMINLYANDRAIPPLMTFYAKQDDKLLFTFGLAKLAKTIFGNTPEGGDEVFMDETKMREFEDAHSQLLFHSDDMAAVGFIDSEQNRFNGAGYMESRCFYWMQACWVRNIPHRMCRVERPESWDVPVLVVNEVHILTEEEIANLKDYAARGGTLVVSGICGEQSAGGVFRSREEINALWGFDLYDESFADSFKIVPYGSGNICQVGYSFGYPGSDEEKYQRFVFDQRRRERDFVQKTQFCQAISIPRFGTVKEKKIDPVINLYCSNAPYFDRIAEFLQDLADSKLSFKAQVPDLVLAAPQMLKKERKAAIHLLNAVNTMPLSHDTTVSHEYDLANVELTGEGVFTLQLPDDGVQSVSAEFKTIDGKSETVAVKLEGNCAVVTLPLEKLKIYAMIEVVWSK